MKAPTIEFPDKLQCLFEPHRYKVLHGGRGGAKSWGVARYLLIDGATRPQRFLCTREVQKSIKESVHKLLSDQIQKLGLGSFYEVQQAVIKGINGTEFVFAGLSDQTAESIKSFEGVDKAWVEEAQAVSKRSWDILIPTIRKDGSEIIVTLNPELDTDPTYVRMIENPPPDSVVVQINYHDNPWFPDVLRKEREHALASMSKADYENIWEGKCRSAVAGAIYADEIAAAHEHGRICDLPYDPALKVHVIFDLGWNDSMALILVQKHVSQLRVIEYIEDDHKTLDWYSNELKSRSHNWGKLYLPHDGKHKDFKTGKSSQAILQELGWDVEITPNQSIEEGIKNARRTFPQVYFDRAKTTRLVECLKRYRRGVPATTGEPGAPVHDEWSHGADDFRYLCINAPGLTNETWGATKITYPRMANA
jgi:phage terminase large subunit